MNVKRIAKSVPVAGVTYYKEALQIVHDNEDRTIIDLVPEPNNSYDPNAIAVVAMIKGLGDFKIGYIPKALAAQLNGTFEVNRIKPKTVKVFKYDGTITGLRLDLYYEHNPDDA